MKEVTEIRRGFEPDKQEDYGSTHGSVVHSAFAAGRVWSRRSEERMNGWRTRVAGTIDPCPIARGKTKQENVMSIVNRRKPDRLRRGSAQNMMGF